MQLQRTFFQRISTQPKAVSRVLGVFGVAKELRAPTSPPPTPPGVGGWGTTAGASPRPLPGAACGSGCLHGRRANVVRRAHRQAPGRAPRHGAAADLRTGAGQKVPDIRCRGANLEDVYYSWQLARNQTGKVKEWCCLCDLPCCEGLNPRS